MQCKVELETLKQKLKIELNKCKAINVFTSGNSCKKVQICPLTLSAELADTKHAAEIQKESATIRMYPKNTEKKGEETTEMHSFIPT